MIVKALQKIRPGAEWVLNGDDYGDLNWLDTVQSKPTREEVSQAVAIVQAEYTAQEYQRLRKYPSLGDQLDMLWHAIDNGTLNKTSDFYTAIKAVKDAHPKE